VTGELADATPARRPERVILDGHFVRLEPLDPAAHAEALYEGSHGPEREDLYRYLFPEPSPDLESFRARMEESAASQDRLFFAVVDAATGRALGHATYLRIDPANRVIEVGNILYTPALQRSPGGTEAMYLMARHAFEDLGYRRYEWKCNALNEPSKRAALRLGFAYEGTFRQHMIVKGRSRDTAWFAMLDKDWPVIRARLERWLAPENFDENGRQRVSLSALAQALS